MHHFHGNPWRTYGCLQTMKNPTAIKKLKLNGICGEEVNAASFLPKEISRGHYVSLVTTTSLASGRCLAHSRHSVNTYWELGNE